VDGCNRVGDVPLAVIVRQPPPVHASGEVTSTHPHASSIYTQTDPWARYSESTKLLTYFAVCRDHRCSRLVSHTTKETYVVYTTLCKQVGRPGEGCEALEAGALLWALHQRDLGGVLTALDTCQKVG
jgi:hypothetical protein